MAAEMTSVRVTALAGEPVDSLIWRAVGQSAGRVETVLEANPGLTELGATLPEGTVVDVVLPATPAPDAPLVQLWS
jgi:phage tail protein X